MHFRPRHLAALVALLTSTVAGPAAARRVGEVVATAAAQARFAVPAVATGTVTFQHDEMVDAVPVIMLAHRRTLRVEIRGLRALVRGSKALVYERGTVQARRDLPIVGSNVLFEDLTRVPNKLLRFEAVSPGVGATRPQSTARLQVPQGFLPPESTSSRPTNPQNPHQPQP
jgi:hypothetical protein